MRRNKISRCGVLLCGGVLRAVDRLVKCARVVLQALVECISEHIECEQGAGAAEPVEDEDEVYSVQVSLILTAV